MNSWIRVLIEKLIFAHPIKKFPIMYGVQRLVIASITPSILSQTNSDYILASYFLISIIILFFHLYLVLQCGLFLLVLYSFLIFIIFLPYHLLINRGDNNNNNNNNNNNHYFICFLTPGSTVLWEIWLYLLKILFLLFYRTVFMSEILIYFNCLSYISVLTCKLPSSYQKLECKINWGFCILLHAATWLICCLDGKIEISH
jgi:hypothetical protein